VAALRRKGATEELERSHSLSPRAGKCHLGLKEERRFVANT
jgi:hypothetical protein